MVRLDCGVGRLSRCLCARADEAASSSHGGFAACAQPAQFRPPGGAPPHAPMPPPPGAAPAQELTQTATIRNAVNLKKATLALVPLPDSPKRLAIRFDFDASEACRSVPIHCQLRFSFRPLWPSHGTCDTQQQLLN